MGILNGVSDVFLKFFELMEAEGRELRKNTAALLLGGVLFFVAGCLATAGAALILFGTYRLMLPTLGGALACLATGALALAAAASLFAFAYKRAAENFPARQNEVANEPDKNAETDASPDKDVRENG
ncbi:MAG: hypothetical protein LBT31_06250 [Synergistaceae bacterium]|jgi:hypothetical protein|nr:hypothetical protein [Synergistaceae bacterium]